MTKEQAEAIGNIKIFIKCIRSDLTEESEDNQKLSDDLETVLNMLKEKDEEAQQYFETTIRQSEQFEKEIEKKVEKE